MDFDKIVLVWNEEGDRLVGQALKNGEVIAEAVLNELMSEVIADQVMTLLGE
jgi:hypothetical protein